MHCTCANLAWFYVYIHLILRLSEACWENMGAERLEGMQVIIWLHFEHPASLPCKCIGMKILEQAALKEHFDLCGDAGSNLTHAKEIKVLLLTFAK